MEKKGSSCPSAVCEKISKAVSKYPAFRLARRISSRHQEPDPATSASEPSEPPTPSVKTIDIQSQRDSPKLPKQAVVPQIPWMKETAETIPVNYAPSTKLQPAKAPETTNSSSPNQKSPPTVTKTAPKFETEPAPGIISPRHGKFKSTKADDSGGKKATGNNEDHHFGEYIARVRNKISRSISNIGDGMKIGRTASTNIGDKSTSRDQKKIGRTASTNIGDKSTSRDQKDNFTEYIDRAKLKIRRMSTVGTGK